MNTPSFYKKILWTLSCLGLANAGTFATAAVEMEHAVLHRDDTMYYLGASLARLPSGEILLGLREAHARPPKARGHVDPSARDVFLRSSDGGRTFGQKRVVDDETYRFSSSQDLALSVLSDGSVLASFYTWGIVPVPTGIDLNKIHSGARLVGADKPFISLFEGLWTRRSTDSGRTWSPRHSVDIPGLPPLAARTPAVELPDGTLLLQVNEVALGAGSARPWAKIFCVRSHDRGVTWGEAALVADGSALALHFMEPSLVRLKNGRLISMLRSRGVGEGGDERRGELAEASNAGYTYQSISEDGGKTWSKLEKTPIWGFPSHVLELQDGRLLCAYGYRRPPFGVRATLSSDGGKTWDIGHEIVIRADGGTSDLGYPVSIQLPDGRILMAYYFNQEKKNDPDSSTRYIAGTFLKL